MAERYTDEELDREILGKLWRRGLFGGRYQPVEQVVSAIPRELRGRARDRITALWRDGLLRRHKNGACVSIDPRRTDAVRQRLDGYLPDYYLDR
ncbi:MAG: hypothetical protein ABEI97_03080 [Candidatus Nanohaloarchaea archaeon]